MGLLLRGDSNFGGSMGTNSSERKNSISHTHTHTHALIHVYLRCILVWLNQICLQSMYMYLTSCRYTLNTVVDPPHSNTITSLAFSPIPEMYHSQNKSSTLPMAVTTSLDGCFKLWISVEKEESKSSWACRSVSTYHDLPCCGSAFSDDGSLLVVNFSKVSNPPPPTSHLMATVTPSYSL